MNSSLLEKIKKLLSLAQSSNEHERDLALQKATALAAEHNIDMALIDASSVGVLKDEPMVQEDFTHKKVRARPVEHRFVSVILREYFNVDIVWGWHGAWHFIGRREDTQFAAWLCGFLLEEFDRRWKNYRNTELALLEGVDARQYRNTYVYGLYQGLIGKLAQAKSEAEAAKFSAPVAGTADAPAPTAEELRNRYALVVQDLAKKRKDATRSFFPSLRQTRGRRVSVRSHSTLAAGVAAGRTINCSRALAA